MVRIYNFEAEILLSIFLRIAAQNMGNFKSIVRALIFGSVSFEYSHVSYFFYGFKTVSNLNSLNTLFFYSFSFEIKKKS